jgi:hypothetical protein
MQEGIGRRPEYAGFIGIPRLARVSADQVPSGKAWSFYRSLFVPQRNHRIDFRCEARRKIGRDENRDEGDPGEAESDNVHRADAVEAPNLSFHWAVTLLLLGEKSSSCSATTPCSILLQDEAGRFHSAGASFLRYSSL